MLKKMMLLFVLITISFASFADESVSNRKIIDIGCHSVDDTCFVMLSGAPFGSQEKCTSSATNEFRFSSSTPDGKRTYASLLAAFLAKRTVDIELRGCDARSGAVTLVWFHIR
ncbi:hypothetical protein [Acinetobacter bereziniae]|uniref:hypothetical protein n=1 Tax=Acinetobacter bereziniae TaxID=106648 RepID=UPI0012503AD0|nr:hypothetical protein [Acinetobacter bereziniae]